MLRLLILRLRSSLQRAFTYIQSFLETCGPFCGSSSSSKSGSKPAAPQKQISTCILGRAALEARPSICVNQRQGARLLDTGLSSIRQTQRRLSKDMQLGCRRKSTSVDLDPCLSAGLLLCCSIIFDAESTFRGVSCVYSKSV